MDLGREIAEAFTAVQAERVPELLDEIGASWWRAHKLADGLGEPWLTLDACLLETSALARETFA